MQPRPLHATALRYIALNWVQPLSISRKPMRMLWQPACTSA